MQTIMCSFVWFGRPEEKKKKEPSPAFHWDARSVRETESKVTFLLSSTICR